uniref:Uncharacterized protein n=1 Tax=uncultured prokaryote TaxID=198431 RepID=A0A0H5Q3K6_9ZZZZ|nr:hypothetical protein [uncultured prokaryote]
MSLVIPVGFGLAAIQVTGAAGTAPYVTTMGVDLAAAEGDYVAAANNVLASYVDAFEGLTGENFIMDRVSLFVGDGDGGGSVESTDPGTAGLRDGDMAPVGMAAIARKVTTDLGRKGKGRMFLPGMLADLDVDEGGSIPTASRDIFTARATSFLTNLLDADPAMPLPPVLFHSEGSVSTVPTPIQGMVCSEKVGWIRGRIR